MAEVAQLLRKERDRTDAGREPHVVAPHSLYFAFLSYSHADAGWGEWLHDALEKFRVPSSIAGRLTHQGVVPKRLTPIFRDRKELAASTDLGAEIREAITASRYLIVLCSPAAATSQWTNAEIDTFKRVRPDGSVLAVIVDGEPFASDVAGHEAEECLPPALRIHYDRRGRPTPKRAEPLCTDLREDRDGKRLGLLKLVAGMLGVGLDDLVQRETVRRQRRLAILAAVSLSGMAITSTLAIVAFQARDAARDQRREAEGLVQFMLGDLRDKLEPIGKLDALDAVGNKALAYYSKQNLDDLSDEALAQRSSALTLMGEIASTRGDLDGALRRYREAMSGTAELVSRSPDNPQRLFDHAQNVYYWGEVAERRGRLDIAETAMREYKRLADEMVAIEPDNRKWQLEVKYSENNLGAILLKLKRYPEASRQFAIAIALAEKLAASDPGNEEYQLAVPETLGWLADAQFGEGRLDEAIAQRERQVAILETLMRRSDNVDNRARSIPARRALGRMLVSSGSNEPGLDQAYRAVEAAAALMPAEPDNMNWLEYAAGAKLDLAAILLSMGRTEEAAAQTRSACDLSSRLLARDRTVVVWRSIEIDCLTRRAQLALAAGSNAEGEQLARRTVSASKEFKGRDEADAGFTRASSYKLLGDSLKREGRATEASQAWTAALATWPKSVAETPRQTAIRAQVLLSLGRNAEAAPLEKRLAEVGYRRLI